MGRRRSWLACALAAATLASPASAWAQGAGDDQYSDPFGDEQEQEEQAPEPAPAPAEPEPAAPEQPAQTAQAPAAQEQLPRTGADEGLVALAGVVMLAGGIALRLRLRS